MGAIDLINLGLTIAEGVTRGVAVAVQAKTVVDTLIAERRDPTDAEWATINAAADAAHVRVQGVGG